MDSGTFIATAVQASATIFAIVAGLITVSVLNLSSSRSQIGQELTLAWAHRNSLEIQHSNFQLERDRVRMRWIMYDEDFVLSIFRKEFDDISPEKLREQYGASDIEQGRWDLAYINFVQEVAAEIVLLGGELKRTGGPRMGYFEWVSANSIDMTDRNQWIAHVIYKELLRLRAEKAREKADAEPFGRHLSSLIYSPDPAIIAQEMQEKREQEQEHWDEVRSLDQRMIDINSEVERIDTNIEHMNQQFDRIRIIPRDVIWGFIVLATLAISGIAIPMSVIVANGSKVGTTGRVGILVTLLVGIVAMFIYLFVLIWPRSKPSAEES